MSGIFLLLPPLLCLWWGPGVSFSGAADTREWKTSLRLAIGCAAVAFFVGDPYLWLDSAGSSKGLAFQFGAARTTPSSLSGLLSLAPIWRQISFVIPEGLTWPVAAGVYVAVLLHSVSLLRPRSMKASPFFASMFAFCALYLYAMARGYNIPDCVRAMLPLFPCGCLLLGLSWAAGIGHLAPRGRTALNLIGLGMLLVFPVRYSVAYGWVMMQEDTRVTAKRWIDENVPREEKMGWANPYGFWSVPLLDRSMTEVRPIVPMVEGSRRVFHVHPKILENSEVRYWVVSDFEIDEAGLARIEAQTSFRRIREFVWNRGPLGVNFKEGKSFPHDYIYPCLNVYVLKRMEP